MTEKILDMQVSELAKARKELRDINEFMGYIMEELVYKNPKYIQAKEKRDKLSELSSMLDEDVRKLALLEFERTENKKPHPSVNIKETTTVTVLDENKAKEWVSINLPSALTIAKGKFNKAVKTLELDFVEINKNPSAYIGADLSKYLE